MSKGGQKRKQNNALQKAKIETPSAPRSGPSGSIKVSETRFALHQFAGPIPPPEILAKFAEIMPNAPDRIFTMAESQEAHRQRLEAAVVNSDIRQSQRGLIAGSLLSALVISGGIYLLSIGQSIQGLVAVLTPLAGLACVFVYATESRKRERLERSRTRGEQTKN